MFMHPANAAALAEQHRQYLTAQAHTRAARTTRRSAQGAQEEIVMDRIRIYVGRFARILVGLAGTLLALSVAPAAFAMPRRLPPPGGDSGAGASVPAPAHTAVRPPPGVVSRLEGPVQQAPPQQHGPALTHIHTAVASGMPGWQITLIAIGAALAAATLAVLLDRAVMSRRRVSPTTA